MPYPTLSRIFYSHVYINIQLNVSGIPIRNKIILEKFKNEQIFITEADQINTIFGMS